MSQQLRIEFLRTRWIGLRVVCIAGSNNDGRALSKLGQQQLEQKVVRQMVHGERGLKTIFRALIDIRKLCPCVQHQAVDQAIAKLLNDALRKFADTRKAAKVERSCVDVPPVITMVFNGSPSSVCQRDRPPETFLRWVVIARYDGDLSHCVFLNFARHVMPREWVVHARKYGLEGLKPACRNPQIFCTILQIQFLFLD